MPINLSSFTTIAHPSRSIAILAASCLTALGGLLAPPATAAERVTIAIGAEEIAIPVADIETFAKQGVLSDPLAAVAQQLDPQDLQQLYGLLQQSIDVEPSALLGFTSSPVVEALLTRLGRAIQNESGNNGGADIRTAAGLAAYDPQGVAISNFLYHFPGSEVRIRLEDVVQLSNELKTQLDYRNAALGYISRASAAVTSPASTATEWPDLSAPGSFPVEVQSVVVPVGAVRPTEYGFVTSYDFSADVYLPQGNPQAAPTVVFTHGFGESRQTYAYLANHLASHGFAVIAPEHVGSDLNYREVFLEGELSNLLSPMEYVSRSLDITYTLNHFEQLAQTDPEWSDRLDLNRVGVFGNSLGGTTALSVAGASIDETRLQQECAADNLTLDVSVVLQCPAKHLPPVNYDLRDDRIAAAIAAYPLTNVLYGPEGMGKIEVPTLMVSGSNDIITPPPFKNKSIHLCGWTPPISIWQLFRGAPISPAAKRDI